MTETIRVVRSKKKVVFLTGTRADFGKLRKLIEILQKDELKYDVNIFVTGMHMFRRFGSTINEVRKAGFSKLIHPFINQNNDDSMDQVLGNTILGIGRYLKEVNPDLLVVHGDRVECLAGALAASLQNIRVAHIEGGEVSGSIDEVIRHATTKFSHHHFVANKEAAALIKQLGESPKRISVIGSPDLDVMNGRLPSLASVKTYYDINFKDYAIMTLHPVTTLTIGERYTQAEALCKVAMQSKQNYIVIQPNNDHGADQILLAYEKYLVTQKNVKIFPSLRFESFLTLLKNSKFIVGNSSAGVREAPFWGIPAINLGERQLHRSQSESIRDATFAPAEISDAIRWALEKKRFEPKQMFGDGKSAVRFKQTLDSAAFWKQPIQKNFGVL